MCDGSLVLAIGRLITVLISFQMWLSTFSLGTSMELIALFKIMGNRLKKKSASNKIFMVYGYIFNVIGDTSVIVPGCTPRREQGDTIEE